MTLQIVNGSAARKLVSQADAIEAMRQMFLALDRGVSVVFPPLVGHGSWSNTRFGVKAGFDGDRRIPGLKVGTYWTGNADRGEPNHGSTTLLLDDESGRPLALVEATWLNALRTAASDAIGTDLLARADASVLAIIGTGNQAYHEARAVASVRDLQAILVSGRNAHQAGRLASRLQDDGLPASPVPIDDALDRADIIATVTASRTPLFAADKVRPGAHISAMGADGIGKQELPADLLERASLFADLPSQSLTIGEFQHISGSAAANSVCSIGAVLAGHRVGRRSPHEITIYDSSGFGLQDIAIAALALERARKAGLVIEVDF